MRDRENNGKTEGQTDSMINTERNEGGGGKRERGETGRQKESKKGRLRDRRGEGGGGEMERLREKERERQG